MTLDHYTCAISNFDFILTMGLGSSLTVVVACGGQGVGCGWPGGGMRWPGGGQGVACGGQGVGCGSCNVSHQSATRAEPSRRFLLKNKLQDYRLQDYNMKEGEGGECVSSYAPHRAFMLGMRPVMSGSTRELY